MLDSDTLLLLYDYDENTLVMLKISKGKKYKNVLRKNKSLHYLSLRLKNILQKTRKMYRKGAFLGKKFRIDTSVSPPKKFFSARQTKRGRKTEPDFSDV